VTYEATVKSRHKRSITIARHRTSVSLGDAFWEALGELAEADGRSVAELVSEIDRRRGGINRAGTRIRDSDVDLEETSLSAAIRLYVLERMQARKP
jgi:predicted DNA-binding ribbon-helix-helix protein